MHTRSQTPLFPSAAILFIALWYNLTFIDVRRAFAQELWTTTADRSQLLTLHSVGAASSNGSTPLIQLHLDPKLQPITGFGATLTDGSVEVINRLSEEDKSKLLDELFCAPPIGIGISVVRLSVGASDLSSTPYTYNDSEEPDPELTKFDFSMAETTLIPMLREIKNRNPHTTWMATPWTAPVWMKDKANFVGGTLKPQYYTTYARYLTKYLSEMKTAGIDIQYVMVQNEPENGHNNPSMVMTAIEQADFIGNHLGPQLAKADLRTKILAYDHNCDHPEYPITVLRDSKANPFIAGTAFHLYAGDIRALSKVHEIFPNKELHFTEQWVSSEGDFGGDLMWHTENVLIGALQNWSKTVLEWNLAADSKQHPHTEGGCDKCLGALTIDGKVTRNVAYYIIAHASKFIPPGSQRIPSTSEGSLPHVACLTPEGKIVVLLQNKSNDPKSIAIAFASEIYQFSLAPRSLNTFVTSQ